MEIWYATFSVWTEVVARRQKREAPLGARLRAVTNRAERVRDLECWRCSTTYRPNSLFTVLNPALVAEGDSN